MRRLIRKEREIYDLYESGLNVEQIAKELFVNVGTVEFWLYLAKKKKGDPSPEDE